MPERKPPAKKVGRPPKYDAVRFPVVARSMARLGATLPEIAEALQVSLAAIKVWQKHPEFVAAIKDGKALADSHVEDGLYRRALGYEYVETKIIERGDSTVTETTTKQRAPDVTAQIFWLKNRKPAEWRDVQQRELSGKDGGPISITHDALAGKLLPELVGGGKAKAT